MNTKFAGRVASGFAVVMIVAAPFFAGAVSIDELQAQLKNLMAQIAQVQGQSSAGISVSSGDSTSARAAMPAYRICSVVARNLAQGSRGDDVSSLQEYLRGEGYLSANATGFYGSLTAAAVAKWQAKEGLNAAGAFGPLSRARISKWCQLGGGSANKMRFEVSPTSGSAPLTVTANTWLSAFRINTISYEINYGDGTTEKAADCYAPADGCISPGQNTHTYTANGTYRVTLSQITNNCPAGAQCFAGPTIDLVAEAQVTVGTQVSSLSADPSSGAVPLSVGFTFRPADSDGQYTIEYGDGSSEQMTLQQIYCIRAPCISPFVAKHVYKSAGTYTATVSQYIACLHTAPYCKMMQPAPVAKVQVVVKGASSDPANDPQCKAYFDGCNSCGRTTPGGPAACTLMYCANPAPAYCKAYFDSSANKEPTISGISGPSTLAISSTGTWTIQASDPEGGQLSYQVWWGDENAYASGMTTASAARDFTQSTTFTHSYANAGTYTVTITVQDPTGQSAKTSTTVKVGSDVVACTMEYAPVCGQPKWSCPSGMFCATMMPAPLTYGNRCQMNAAGATYISEGQCTSPYVY